MMRLFNQNTGLFANMTLGESKATGAQYGCNCVSICEISSYFDLKGAGIDPCTLASADVFAPDGEIDYTKLNLWLKEHDDYFRFTGATGYDKTLAVNAVNDPDRAVILKLMVKGRFSHFVVGVSYSPVLGWRVADSFTGTIRYLNVTGYGQPVSCRFYNRVKQ